jgi:hypothetical protein
MKHILLTLLLLSPLAFAEDKWWDFDLGVDQDLYDMLLEKSEEESRSFFYREATKFQSLYCRSNFNFVKADRNITKCFEDATEKFIAPLEKILNVDSPQNTSLEYSGLILDFLSPQVAANISMINFSSVFAQCVPENIGKPSISNQLFIDDCAEKFHVDLSLMLSNANRYSRVVFLKKRGLLIDAKKSNSTDSSSILDLSDTEIAQLHNYLTNEFNEVYCRSGFGITLVNDSECLSAARGSLDFIDEGVSEDIEIFNLEYINADMVKAFAIQYMTIAFEKCVPFTLYLDEFFNAKQLSEEELESIKLNASRCAEETLSGYVKAILEAEAILFREAIWKIRQDELDRKKIAEAKSIKEKEALRASARRQELANKESVGGLFGRVLIASLSAAAEGYVKEKISKELGIKTGVYHSQDMKYCYYSTPNGIQKVKKKGGRSKTVNLGNVGTNKQVVQYQKSMPGISSRETIYSFADSSAVSTTRTKIYNCDSRL